MKIAFLTSEYVTEENYSGGLANYLYRVGMALNKAGHEVQIFVLSKENNSFSDQGIAIRRVKKISKLKVPILKRYTKTITTLINASALKKAVLKEHEKNKIDIVQAASYLAVGFSLIRSGKIPVVTRISSFTPVWRSYNGVRSTLDSLMLESLEILSLRDSLGVYAPTDNLRSLINSYEPIDIRVIRPPFEHYSVEEDRTIYEQFNVGKKYLLFFGTMAEIKGVSFILRNLADILKRHSDVDFVFIGKHGNEKRIKESASPYDERVHHIDAIKKEQLKPFIKNATAVVLPSKIDNLPNTCLESMADGAIVLTTRTSGFNDIINNGENGFLITYGDDKEFQGVVDQILSLNDKERQKISSEAKKTIREKFSEQNITELLEFYEEKINEWKKSVKS